MEEIELGDAFLMPDRSGDKKHLYIVIAIVSENNYLLVNITTSNKQIDPGKDCVINPGEGVTNFVTCQSTVAYGYAHEFRKNQINKLIQEGKCRRDGRFSREQVYRMQEKGSSSKSIPKKYKNILEQVLQERELNRYICENLGRRLG